MRKSGSGHFFLIYGWLISATLPVTRPRTFRISSFLVSTRGAFVEDLYAPTASLRESFGAPNSGYASSHLLRYFWRLLTGTESIDWILRGIHSPSTQDGLYFTRIRP